MRYLMENGECSYEDAIEVSNRAILNFTLDSDKKRQYQYRAWIEAEQGNYEESLHCLYRGFGVSGWESFFETGLLQNPFALYHLSGIVRKFVGDKKYAPDIMKMLKKFQKNEKAFLAQGRYPDFLTCANIARAMEAADYDENAVGRYYEKAAASTDEDGQSAIFRMLKIMIRAEYIAVLKQKNDFRQGEAIARMKEACAELRCLCPLPQGMEPLLERGEALCEEDNPEAFFRFSRLHQY